MRENDLPSILLAAATLVAVLLGSFVLAMTYLTENDAEAGRPPEAAARQDCRAATSCRVASAELKAAFDDPNACDGAGARVCLVPMGDVPKDVIDGLVTHYKTSYGLTIHVAQPLDLRTGFDRRGQLEESLLHAYLLDAYREYAADRSVTLIGILALDIYLGDKPGSAWGFGRLKGEPKTDGSGEVDYRSGIVSLYRMDPANWGLLPMDRLRDERLQKMVSKYIAHAHFGLQVTADPGSITYYNVTDLNDLDRLNERIPIR